MIESRILMIFGAVIGIPALGYFAYAYGLGFAFALFLAMWAQNAWLNAQIVRDLEQRYEDKEAARQRTRNE